MNEREREREREKERERERERGGDEGRERDLRKAGPLHSDLLHGNFLLHVLPD